MPKVDDRKKEYEVLGLDCSTTEGRLDINVFRKIPRWSLEI